VTHKALVVTGSSILPTVISRQETVMMTLSLTVTATLFHRHQLILGKRERNLLSPNSGSGCVCYVVIIF